MKKAYKICVICALVEFVIIYFLDKANIQLNSFFIKAVGALLFFLPIILLLVMMSKDEKFSSKKRQLFKGMYLFVIFCYICALIAKIV